MAFWGEQDWILTRSSTNFEIVKGFEPSRLKDGCYRLSIGPEAVLTIAPQDQGTARRSLAKGEFFEIQPGQFAHLITREVVQLPDNAIGLINIATAEKTRGLVNVSGFHVDAAYEGKLVFTVFNAGATSISLSEGQRLFRLWLMDYRGTPSVHTTSFDSIPSEWADRLRGAYPSPFALATRIDSIDLELKQLRVDQRLNLITYALAAALVFPLIVSLVATLSEDWLTGTVFPAFENIQAGWVETFSNDQSSPEQVSLTPTADQQSEASK